MENNENNLKKFIQMMLKMNCLTPTEFCIKMKIHRSLLYQYYHDSVRPTVAMCLKMADVLECSPKEVLEQVKPRRRQYGKHVF